MEKAAKSSLPIIGTDEFGLTEEQVIKAQREAAENVQGWREQLNDTNERIRESSRRFLPNAEIKLQALSIEPKDVLARAKTFYDRTVELGSSGLDDEELTLKLGDEFPDLMNYYGLLRMKTWGYNLGQKVSAAAAERQIKKLSEK